MALPTTHPSAHSKNNAAGNAADATSRANAVSRRPVHAIRRHVRFIHGSITVTTATTPHIVAESLKRSDNGPYAEFAVASNVDGSRWWMPRAISSPRFEP